MEVLVASLLADPEPAELRQWLAWNRDALSPAGNSGDAQAYVWYDGAMAPVRFRINLDHASWRTAERWMGPAAAKLLHWLDYDSLIVPPHSGMLYCSYDQCPWPRNEQALALLVRTGRYDGHEDDTGQPVGDAGVPAGPVVLYGPHWTASFK